MIRFVYIMFGLAVSLNVSGQFAESFDAFKNSSALNGAFVGVCFIDISTGETVYGNSDHKFFYPASVQKTITTAAALGLMGEDYYYETKALYSGLIEEGVLKGSIIIETSGDPTTNSAYFNPNFKADLIQALKSKGIKEIEGSILFDSKDDSHGTPQSWLYEDIGNYYGVAPQQFNYKDNLYKLTFQQKANGVHPSIIKTQPTVPYRFDLKLTCSSSQKGDHAFILGAPFSEEREVAGTITAGTGTFTVKGANAHPQFTFIEELKEEIKIDGNKLINGKTQFLCSSKSPSLSAIIQLTNFESINLFAEGILNTLGLNFMNEYSTDAGIEVLINYIAQKELDTKEVILKDGSGLSRLNAMTPHFAANWIYEHYEIESFRNSLSVSGETGTMRYLNHARVKGAIHAKSGSAEGVVNYAGYFKSRYGKNYAFSIFINQAYQSRYSIRREIGVFLESLI